VGDAGIAGRYGRPGRGASSSLPLARRSLHRSRRRLHRRCRTPRDARTV